MRKPNPLDANVGAVVRARRRSLGMSQGKLGQALGISLQQVQKNESGTNRIGASRLQQLSKILGVPVVYFFEDASSGAAARYPSGDDEDRNKYIEVLDASEWLQFSRAFATLRDAEVRKIIFDLVLLLSPAVKSAP